jgi:hypothetical protein
MALNNPLQRVRGLLREDRTLAVLLPEAERLRELNGLFARSVPKAVARACQVAAVKDGEAQVYCGNGSAAARLRSLSATVSKALAAGGAPVSGLRVRVRADWSLPERSAKPGMGRQALAAWGELDGALAEGELKSAVDRLLRHQRHGG